MNYTFSISDIRDKDVPIQTQIQRGKQTLEEAKQEQGWANMLFRQAVSQIIDKLEEELQQTQRGK
jgi:hypothetical protein